MISGYIHAAMRLAKYELLLDGDGFYGDILELRGVWANEPVLETAATHFVTRSSLGS